MGGPPVNKAPGQGLRSQAHANNGPLPRSRTCSITHEPEAAASDIMAAALAPWPWPRLIADVRPDMPRSAGGAGVWVDRAGFRELDGYYDVGLRVKR